MLSHSAATLPLVQSHLSWITSLFPAATEILPSITLHPTFDLKQSIFWDIY
jgi:hypothetical protein